MMNSPLVKGIFWTVLLAGLLAVMFTAREAKAQSMQLKCFPFDDVIMKKEKQQGRLPFASGQASGGTLVIFVNPKTRQYAMFHRPTKKFEMGCLMGSGKDFSAFKQGDPT